MSTNKKNLAPLQEKQNEKQNRNNTGNRFNRWQMCTPFAGRLQPKNRL
jgi:hypothetical protein